MIKIGNHQVKLIFITETMISKSNFYVHMHSDDIIINVNHDFISLTLGMGFDVT